MVEALTFIAENVILVALGAGLFPLLRLSRSWWFLDLALAYVIGYAAAGTATSILVLARISVGVIAVAIATVAALLVIRSLRGKRASTLLPSARPPIDAALGLGVLAAAAIPAFATRPLVDWDAWAIWGLKARALVAFHGADPHFLISTPHADYPLLIPSIEALHFWALGGLGPAAVRLLHVQFLLLGVGFVGAAASLLLRSGVERVAAWRSVALIAANPMFSTQLLTALADAPLAIFVSVGALGLLPQARTNARSFHRLSALMLSAAVATKDEGAVYAAAVVLGAVAVAHSGSRLRTLVLLGGTPLAAAIPWRIYVVTNGIGTGDYRLADALSPHYLLSHAARLVPAVRGLLLSCVAPTWPFVVVLGALALVAAWRRGDRALVRFVAIVSGFPLLSLVLIYWISKPDANWLVESSALRVTLPVGTLLAVVTPALLFSADISPSRGEPTRLGMRRGRWQADALLTSPEHRSRRGWRLD